MTFGTSPDLAIAPFPDGNLDNAAFAPALDDLDSAAAGAKAALFRVGQPHALLELLALARESGAIIIEDDYTSEFRYSGPPLASLQGLTDSEQVIYVGTLNKALLLLVTRKLTV